MTKAVKNESLAGTIINNYNNDNGRTVNQTNHSPKSLYGWRFIGWHRMR